MDKWEGLSNLLAELVLEKSIYKRVEIAGKLMIVIPIILGVKVPKNLQDNDFKVSVKP